MQPRRRTGDSSPLFTAGSHGDASKNISRSLWKVFFCSCEVSCGEMSFIANRITVRMTTRRQAGRVESADRTQHVGQRKTEPPFRFCFLSSFCWIRFCPAAGQRCRTDTHGCIGNHSRWSNAWSGRGSWGQKRRASRRIPTFTATNGLRRRITPSWNERLLIPGKLGLASHWQLVPYG